MKLTMKLSFSVALFALIILFLGFQIVSAVAVLPALEKATAQQCMNHDWPVHAHQIHMDWCADNNYPTN